MSAWTNAPEPSWFPGSDKLAHFCIYAALGALLAWGGWNTWRRPPHLLLLLLGSLYGASDEWHQSFVPGRDSSPWDWGADNVGVVVGYLLFFLVLARIVRSRGGSDVTNDEHRARPDV